MSHLAWLMSLVLLGEKKERKKEEILDFFFVFFFNSSLRPSRASLDQSMHEIFKKPDCGGQNNPKHFTFSPKGCSCTVPMHILLLLFDDYYLLR